jgi:hypothetical protein
LIFSVYQDDSSDELSEVLDDLLLPASDTEDIWQQDGDDQDEEDESEEDDDDDDAEDDHVEHVIKTYLERKYSTLEIRAEFGRLLLD